MWPSDHLWLCIFRWLAISSELQRTSSSVIPMVAAILRPAMATSYSASLLVAQNLSVGLLDYGSFWDSEGYLNSSIPAIWCVIHVQDPSFQVVALRWRSWCEFDNEVRQDLPFDYCPRLECDSNRSDLVTHFAILPVASRFFTIVLKGYSVSIMIGKNWK